MTRSICVVGSINMDLVMEAPRFPRPGETVVGGVFHAYPGGKGANQAIAAARLGAQARMIGCVGDDAWGAELRAAFAADGVDVHGVVTRSEGTTGAAIVAVVPGGENAIVVAPGANEELTPEHVDEHAQAITGADMLLLQLEVPLAPVERAVEIARSADTPVLLNAAPACELPAGLLDRVDVLVVNEVEGAQLAGCLGDDVGAMGIARRLKAKGPGRVVVTLGREGALSFDGEAKVQQPSFSVDCVDTTAAGDAFVAALAVALVEEQRMEQALRIASAAGSLATTRSGATPSMPTREALDELLKG